MKITFLLTWLFIVAIIVAAQWKVFQKAGQPGWAAIIPVYGSIVLLKIIGKPAWWFLLFLIPLVNLVFLVWALNMLSKSFGKDEGFTIGLTLLSPVFIPLLGFGSAKYVGPYGNPVQYGEYQKLHRFDFETIDDTCL